MYVLIDLANVGPFRDIAAPRKPVVQSSIQALVDGTVAALHKAAPFGSTPWDYRFRLYNAWFDEDGRGTQLYEMVRRICRDQYPQRSRAGRVFVTTVECVLPLPTERFSNTLRLEAGFDRYPVSFTACPPAHCPNDANCGAMTLRTWLKNKKCPHELADGSNCRIAAEDICYFHQQKLVDTTIVADTVYIATQTQHVAVYSNDEDMIPGLLTAAHLAPGRVAWLARAESPRVHYGYLLARLGVEYVDARTDSR